MAGKDVSTMSRFTIVNTLDQERWDTFVYQHPKGSIFHTSYMVDVFSGTQNHHPLFLAALDKAGMVLALLVAVRIQTLPDPFGSVSSRSIFYAEPLCSEDPDGVEALTALLAEHDAAMRNKVLFTEVRPLGAAGMEQVALERCGYAYEDYLNFLGDLSQPADELWRAMKRQCKQGIRRGRREGVTVSECTMEEGVDILYDLLRLTYERVRVPLADKSLFVEAFKILQPRDMLRIFIARHDGVPLGAGALLLYKDTVYDWQRGLKRVKSLYPGECLVWHQIEWGQQQHHYRVYDFAGAGWPNKPYGVRDFKRKFGGKLVNYGRYRKIYSPWKLALAEKAYELRRSTGPLL